MLAPLLCRWPGPGVAEWQHRGWWPLAERPAASLWRSDWPSWSLRKWCLNLVSQPTPVPGAQGIRG